MNKFEQYKLGAKPDRQDRRDYYKSDRMKLSEPQLQPNSFVLPFLPPIKDQGNTNSCTGHSVAWFWEAIGVSRGFPYICFSPFYIWYYARLEEGTSTQDEGVQMRSIMSSLNKHGICPEDSWPHSSSFSEEPSYNAQIFAAFKMPAYERCDTLDSIKYALSIEKQPVCIGVPVYDCWYDHSVNNTGIIPYVTNQQILGGHAVTICGYNDETQLLTIANSWGINYGKGGYFYYPYAYILNDWWDAWTAAFDTIPHVK